MRSLPACKYLLTSASTSYTHSRRSSTSSASQQLVIMQVWLNSLFRRGFRGCAVVLLSCVQPAAGVSIAPRDSRSRPQPFVGAYVVAASMWARGSLLRSWSKDFRLAAV
jgi:hypothetical protein